MDSERENERDRALTALVIAANSVVIAVFCLAIPLVFERLSSVCAAHRAQQGV